MSNIMLFENGKPVPETGRESIFLGRVMDLGAQQFGANNQNNAAIPRELLKDDLNENEIFFRGLIRYCQRKSPYQIEAIEMLSKFALLGFNMSDPSENRSVRLFNYHDRGAVAKPSI